MRLFVHGFLDTWLAPHVLGGGQKVAALAAQRISTGGWCSAKQSLHTEVLIKFWQVDYKASASNGPGVTLPRGSVQEKGIPS
jgi:hypothetical protein